MCQNTQQEEREKCRKHSVTRMSPTGFHPADGKERH